MDLIFRAMAETDRNFVLSSWLRTYAHSGEVKHTYDERVDDYYRDYEPVVKALIARSQVICAVLPENHDVVVGWVCVEDDTLHYVLVKPRFRECGIAGQLLDGMDALPLAYTHRTGPAFRRLRFPTTWAFRPFRRYAT
jgi:GNAT superfamily N-acetyltransferase